MCFQSNIQMYWHWIVSSPHLQWLSPFLSQSSQLVPQVTDALAAQVHSCHVIVVQLTGKTRHILCLSCGREIHSIILLFRCIFQKRPLGKKKSKKQSWCSKCLWLTPITKRHNCRSQIKIMCSLTNANYRLYVDYALKFIYWQCR